jgi:hypothetical protein
MLPRLSTSALRVSDTMTVFIAGDRLRREIREPTVDRSRGPRDEGLPEALRLRLEAARGACAEALDADAHAHLIESLPGAPQDAVGWFDLLAGYPERAESVHTIRRMKSALPLAAAIRGANVERYALLQAFTTATTRIGSSPVAESVKYCFASTCEQIAANEPQWRPFYDEASVHFMEGVKLATLQRFPAGDLVFAIYDRLPYSWLLKVCPAHLPGLVRQVGLAMGGLGPLITPHINNGRRNQLCMLRKNSLFSLWRIAKTLELNPHVRGFYAVSWFFSAETEREFPHLAWMRTMYTDEGAYVVDMEVAPRDAGFLIGSDKRRQLYDQGKFHPRRSLVLWPRREFLAWAARHPELADQRDEPIVSVAASRTRSTISPRPARSGPHNSLLHFWNGLALLNRDAKRYMLRVLLAPAAGAAVLSGLLLAWWSALPAFMLALIAAWVIQYYCFQ